MLSNDKTVSSLTELYQDVKAYVLLQKEYITLDLVEKLTRLFSYAALGFVLLCIGVVVLFYLSFTLIYLLAPLVGGITASLFIITVILILVAYIIYSKREPLIIAPMTKFITSILLGDKNLKKEIEDGKDGK